MSVAQDEVQSALTLIDSAGLPHPEGPLLSSFVTDAVHPLLAARYVHQGLSDGGSGIQSLVSDWTYIVQSITQNATLPPSPDRATRRAIALRDGDKCCVTGKPGRFWDALIVAPILPVPAGWVTDRPRIYDMLGAFFGPTYRDWWLSCAEAPELTSPYSNHWLVRRSAHRAFVEGRVCLEREQPSMTEYRVEQPLLEPEDPIEVHGSYPLLGDHSRTGIKKVDAHFVGSHARLCRSIRLVEIVKSFAPETLGQPSRPSRTLQKVQSPPPKPQLPRSRAFSLMRYVTPIFLSTWLLFPSRFRIAVYNLLTKLGTLLYGKSTHPAVHRLPFGLYLKHQTCPPASLNEHHALSLLHRHTTIPAPLPLDVIHLPPTNPSDPFSYPHSYLLTTRCPGIPLFRCQYILSPTDMAHITAQMTDYLAQLRTIPRPPSHTSVTTISNTLGLACRDPRIRGETPVGPFKDEEEFNQFLRFSDDPARKGHQAVFTHADLNPRNILVEKGRDGRWGVSGIVDWENAGWYPEYWECTKAFFEGFRWEGGYNRMVEGWFEGFGGYRKEREVEERAWGEGDGV